MGKFSEAAARHALNDTQMIAGVAPPVQEKGTFAKAADQMKEVLPTPQEFGQELGNWAAEAKGFFAKVAAEMGAEMKALGIQGQAEMANALFNGHAYHPGNASAQPEQEKQREQERGMER